MNERFDSVWDALFDDKSEAENLRIRSKLMTIISNYISENKLTQTEAASLLKVSQPRISDIVQGKIGRFTIDTLVNMVAKTNIKVDLIVVRDKAAHENTTVMIYDTKQPWPYFKEGRKRKEVVPEFRFSIGLSKNNKLIDTTGNLASIG